jgi:hypothetical protein
MKTLTVITCSFLVTLSMYGQGDRTAPLVPPPNPVQPVLNVLKEAKAPASLQFFGKCKSFSYPGFPDFPPMSVDSSASESPVQRLRSIFSDDPAMQIRQAPDGSIEMIEENMPQDILDIKIGGITFNSAMSGGFNNPNGAINFVLGYPEVQNFITLHSIQFPYPLSGGVFSHIIGEPDRSRPHISSSFQNVTVRFLLNEIAKTFQNLWIYENCPTSPGGSRVVYIRSYQP